jgi:hypothetical protein
MKKHALLLLSLCVAFSYANAQYVPQGFSYQCVVRDANQNPILNQQVNLVFSIRAGSSNGPTIYSERHQPNTGSNGLVNLTIGKGQSLSGQFSTINWGGGAKFFNVALELVGSQIDLGTTEFQSVPYALHAMSADNGGGGTNGDNWGNQVVQTGATLTGSGTPTSPLQVAGQGANFGQVLKWNGSQWIPQDDIASSGTNGGTVTAINTGTGLTGGPITTSGTIGLSNTGVNPGAYGSTSEIPVITIDAQGRITQIWTAVPSPGTVGLVGGSGIGVQQNGLSFTITNTGDTNPNDDLTTASQHNGDVTGPYTDLQIKPNVITTNEILNQTVLGIDINRMDALIGQVLEWNGATWVPANDDSGITSLDINAGPGIAVTGTSPNFTISNGGDINPTDDVLKTTVADGDVVGIFSNLQLDAGVVGTPELATGAVTGVKIAPMSATTGQVLKWNGTTWAPAADLNSNTIVTAGSGISVTNNAGTYQVLNTGDIDESDDLTQGTLFSGDVSGNYDLLLLRDGVVQTKHLSQMGATAGQILKWNGTAWVAAPDEVGTGGSGSGNTYTGGAGISIGGTAPNLTINNTGDLSNTNEIQTISLAGSVLSLSNGGGSVTLPSGGGSGNNYTQGTGITITGTAPNYTITNAGDLSATNELQNLSLSGTVLSLSGSTTTVDLAGLGSTGQWLPTGGTHLRNANAGNILIGKAVSSYGKLQVESNISNQPAALFTATPTTGDSAAVVARHLGNGPAAKLSSSTGPALITAGGNIGINLPNPLAPLHVRGQDNLGIFEAVAPTLTLKSLAGGPAGPGVTEAFIQLNGRGGIFGSNVDSVNINLMPNNLAAVMTNAKTGKVGIGDVNNENYQLKVFASDQGLNIENTNSGRDWEFWVNSTGELVLYNDQLVAGTPAGVFSANGTYTASDARLKQNIKPMSADALQQILALNPVTYQYLNQEHTLPGLIAQDVQKILPDLVKTVEAHNTTESYLTVNYSALTPLIIKALQEQQLILEQLVKENAALKAQMTNKK